MINREKLVGYVEELLEMKRFDDDGYNGLQVEGKSEIKKIVSGVTANLEFFQKAAKAQADLLLVHHGLFWGKDFFKLDGYMKNRVQFLLKNNLNLLVCHLPLDAHKTYGNAAVLARTLGMKLVKPYDVGWIADFKKPVAMTEFKTLVEKNCNFKVKQAVDLPGKKYRRFLIITGGSASYFSRTFELDYDLFISGEIGERIPALVHETGRGYAALGHYDTETFGVKALGEHLAKKFRIDHEFIYIPDQY